MFMEFGYVTKFKGCTLLLYVFNEIIRNMKASVSHDGVLIDGVAN